MTLHAGIPGGLGTADGTGGNARFNVPFGVAAAAGVVYVADRNNHVIRSVSLATRQVFTVAGSPGRSGTSNGRGKDARFNSPEGVAVSEDGKILYVADTGNHAIRRITLATGDVLTLAGRRGTAGYADSTNGRGDSAIFRSPGALTLFQGNLYVADTDNHRIRQVDIDTGETLTLAGSGDAGFQDGIGSGAILNAPLGIVGAEERSGAPVLYVADTYTGTVESHTIRRIDLSTLEVTTVAGSAGVPGSDDGSALQSTFYVPTGLVYLSGRLYIADRGNAAVREYDPETGEVRSVAGAAGIFGSEDGPLGVGRLGQPAGLATWGGFLYTGDTLNHAVRRVDPLTGEVVTLAGQASHEGSVDGPLGIGRFRNPRGGVIDGDSLYVADTGNHIVRRVDLKTGEIFTIAGRARRSGTTDSTVSPAFFNGPRDVVTDEAEGVVFIVDSGNHILRRMSLDTGAVTTFSGSPGRAGFADSVQDSAGEWVDAQFNRPQGILRIGEFLYLADMGNHAIRVVEIATGRVTTLAGYPGEAGSSDGVGLDARFVAPKDLTTDGYYLYVADGVLPDSNPVQANHVIRRIDPGTGEVVTLVGGAGQAGYVNSAEGDPRLSNPSGVHYDRGFLYIADAGNYAIRKFDLATGILTTLAGDKTCTKETTNQNGVPVETEKCTGTPTSLSNYLDSKSETEKTASFASPAGLAADDRYLYIMDTGNNSLRRLDLETDMVKTIAGGSGFADGAGLVSRFNAPVGGALVNGRLYFADSGNHLIRRVDLSDPDSPRVVTLAGNVGSAGSVDASQYEARFDGPSGIAADGEGNLYVADTGNHTIRKVNLATGRVTTLAGVPGTKGYVNSAFGIPLFNAPWGIVWDRDHLFVADTGNHIIRRISMSTGRVSLVAGHGDERTGTGTAGTEDSTGQAAGFNSPQGITVDETYLYVADTGNHTVRRILKATGEVRTIGGMPREVGSVDDVGFNARFNSPAGVTSDGDYLYVADTGNNLIRRLDKRNKEVVTLSGVVRQSSFTPGTRSEVRYGALTGIATAPDLSDLYLVDNAENAVGRVTK